MDMAMRLDEGMSRFVERNWWVLLIRGLVSVAFGVIAFLWPGATLTTLVLLIGAWFFVDGVFSVIGAIQHRSADRQWWLLLLEGLVGVLAGLGVVFLPGLSTLALLYVFGAWNIITGILEIAAAIRLRREIQGEIWMILGGLLSIVIGVFAFIAPVITALSLVLVLAVYAVLFGIMMIVLAFRARSWAGSHSMPPTPTPVH